MKGLAQPTEMRKKIVVCIVCDIVSDYTAGFLKSAIRITEKLDSKRFKVIFLAGKGRSLGDTGSIGGMKVFRFPSFNVPRTKGKVCLAIPSTKRINEILTKEKVDILHIEVPSYLGYLAVKIANGRGLPVVVTSH